MAGFPHYDLDWGVYWLRIGVFGFPDAVVLWQADPIQPGG